MPPDLPFIGTDSWWKNRIKRSQKEGRGRSVGVVGTASWVWTANASPSRGFTTAFNFRWGSLKLQSPFRQDPCRPPSQLLNLIYALRDKAMSDIILVMGGAYLVVLLNPCAVFRLSPSVYLSHLSQPIFYIIPHAPSSTYVSFAFSPLIYWLLLWISWAQGSVCFPHAKDVLTGLRGPEGRRVRWLTQGLSGETVP